MSFANDDRLTRRFTVDVDDLIDSINSIDDLNERLDAELADEPHLATDISYQVVGFETSPGGTGTLTFEATYTPDPIFEEEK
jgi:hypothetical protein